MGGGRPLQPNFFYASLLAVFGIEIMLDWLGRSFAKVSHFEYGLLWFTFIAICQGAPCASPHPFLPPRSSPQRSELSAAL